MIINVLPPFYGSQCISLRHAAALSREVKVKICCKRCNLKIVHLTKSESILVVWLAERILILSL